MSRWLSRTIEMVQMQQKVFGGTLIELRALK